MIHKYIPEEMATLCGQKINQPWKDKNDSIEYLKWYNEKIFGVDRGDLCPDCLRIEKERKQMIHKFDTEKMATLCGIAVNVKDAADDKERKAPLYFRNEFLWDPSPDEMKCPICLKIDKGEHEPE